jgi:hypothetical protein
MQQSVTVAYPTSAMRTQNARPATRCHIGRAPRSPQSQGPEPPRQNLLVGESCGYGMGFWASQCPFVLPCAEVALWRPPLGAARRRETPAPEGFPSPRRRGAGRRRAPTPTTRRRCRLGTDSYYARFSGSAERFSPSPWFKCVSADPRCRPQPFPGNLSLAAASAVALDERIAVGVRSRTDTFPLVTQWT